MVKKLQNVLQLSGDNYCSQTNILQVIFCRKSNMLYQAKGRLEHIKKKGDEYLKNVNISRSNGRILTTKMVERKT